MKTTNRRGTLITLIGIVIAVMVITTTSYAIYPIIKPLFSNEKGNPSYDKFKELSNRIKVLNSKTSQTALDDGMIFYINQAYSVMAFKDGKADRICEGIGGMLDDEVKVMKPKQCETKACLCLFKGEFVNDDEGKYLNDEHLVGDCLVLENAEFLSMHKKDLQDGSLMRDQIGYNTCVFDETQKITIPSPDVNYKVLDYSPTAIFGSDPTNFELSMDAIELLIYMKRESDGKTRIFIDRKNDVTKERYKKTNTCPPTSDDGCANQHYDYVFTEVPNTDPSQTQMQPIFTDMEGIGEYKYVCKFNEESNVCERMPINNCKNKMIRGSECACGSTAYDSGFCVNNEYFINNLPTDYCFQEKVDSCENYKTNGLYGREGLYACVFDICDKGVTGCHLDKTCKLCPTPESPECEDCEELYDDMDWEIAVDPCKCNCAAQTP